MNPRMIRILVCASLAAGVLIVYGQVGGHDYINLDDSDYVTQNRHVQDGLSLKGVAWALTANHATNWHPLTWLSHMLDWELFGANPAGHHWTSMLIHLANTILLFGLLENMTGARAKSALVAALFAFHPLHVESVAWISERKDVLYTFFWFLALLSYFRYTTKPSLLRYASTVVFFVLSIAAKPMAVTFPFLLFVIDFWPLKRLGWNRRFSWNIIRDKVLFIVIAAISCTLTLWAQLGGGAVATLVHVSFARRLVNAIASYSEYLIHTVWPTELTVFYPLNQRWSFWPIALSACFLLIVTVLATGLRRRAPYLLSGWLWYLGSLVPVIGLVQVGSQRMADRYTYVPLVGIFIIFAWGGSTLLQRLKASSVLRLALGVLVASVLIPVSVKQTEYWKNSLTLFSRAVAIERPSAVAQFQLGLSLSTEKRFDEAILHYRKSLALNPEAINTRLNLAMTYLDAGKPEEALVHLKQAQAKAPNDPGVHNNLGMVYLHIGDSASALLHYEKAVALNPEMTPAVYNLARVYALHSDARYRNGDRAVVLAEKLCDETGRRQPVFLDILAAAYAEDQQFNKAVATANQALELARRYELAKLAADLQKRMDLYRRGEPDRRSLP